MGLIDLFPGFGRDQPLTEENIQLYLAHLAVTNNPDYTIAKAGLRALASDPYSNHLSIQVPRQSGKTTWTRGWCENSNIRTLRVYPNTRALRINEMVHTSLDLHKDLSVTELIRPGVRLTYSEIDLVMFDDAQLYFNGSGNWDPDQYDRLCDEICYRAGNQTPESILFVSLCTPSWMNASYA